MPDKEMPENLEYEVVIGLEVHTELATKTKLFSASPNQFGGEPNTHIDPVSLGLPGSLPVINEHAVELGVRVGLALGSKISPCTFARKNYFYPDMPKDFQISQYEHPLNVGGELSLPSGKKVKITRAHLEEDTGKITHMGGGGRIHDATYCLIDYNRAGVPLLEIVSEPDIESADEAREYVTELRALLVAVGASDGKMEEGSLRVDCNVSVRPKGTSTLGTRCEIKNVNSLRSLHRAIEFEFKRHIEVLKAGQKIKQETRHWNEATGETSTLRSKEGEVDYRYFPEPDLVPIELSEAQIDEIRQGLPSLPAERRRRFVEAIVAYFEAEPQSQASQENLAALFVGRGQDELLLTAIQKGADIKSTLTLAEQNLADGIGELTPEALIQIVEMVKSGDLSATQVKVVLAEVVKSGADPKAVASQHGFEAMDTQELESLLDQLIQENPDEWGRYTAGENKLEGFFVGKIMQATKGQADGKVTAKLLKDKANS